MRRISSIILAAAIIATVGVCYGATYYVATNGNDTWPGSSSQPWATLQYAVDTIAPGDTIIVRAGTYAGCRIEFSGTAVAPKTLMAETVGAVTVNALGPRARHSGIIEIENYDAAVNYWVVDGLVSNGMNHLYRPVDARSIDTQMNTNITIRNCTAIDGYMTGIFAAFTNYALVENCTSYSNNEHGIYVNNSSDYGVVRGNVMYSNVSLGCHMNGDKSMGGDGIMSNWLLEKNISHDNGSNGFDGDGVDYTIWRNNLVYDNTSKGIHLTAVDGAVNPRYDRIYNNTIVNKVGSYYPVNFLKGKPRTGGNNNSIMNNILYHYDYNNSMRGSIDYVSTWEPTLTSDYNVVINRFGMDDNKRRYTLAQWQSTFGQDLHSTLCTDASALWVDPAAKDFHLKATSPAVNAGTTLAEVTDDIEGTSRPQGAAYDCGCYEYH